MKKTFCAVAALAILSGCATITSETTHPIRIETKTAAGTTVTGAECRLTNDYGSSTMRSGDTAQVRRSGADLDIVCTHPQNPNAQARALSRANAGMFGNIIFGGGIGAIIDHNKGTAYTYPTWMQLIFGQTLIFDRSSEQAGQPVPPTAPTAAASSTPATPR